MVWSAWRTLFITVEGASSVAEKKRILIQLDSDPHPSAFDAVVAHDAGTDELFQYGGVAPEQVRDLVYGAIFTRGPKDLHRTAVFIGGKDVAVGEAMLEAATSSFMGPLRVSVMMDANGANTTAAAAVLAARKHIALQGAQCLVLGATGPVGQRVVRLLAGEGGRVRVGSRSQARAATVCERVGKAVPDALLEPVGTGDDKELAAALQDATLVVAAGTEGVTLLPAAARTACGSLEVVVDLNAVPPVGIEGVDVMDKGVEHDGVVCYGAIGTGETKMKIHKAAVASLFEANDRVLDADEIYAIGRDLGVA